MSTSLCTACHRMKTLGEQCNAPTSLQTATVCSDACDRPGAQISCAYVAFCHQSISAGCDTVSCATSSVNLVVHITNMVNRAQIANSGFTWLPISGRQGSCERAASVRPSRHRQNPDWQGHCQQHQGHLLQHQRIFPDQQMDRAGREDGPCLVCSGWLHAACCHLCGRNRLHTVCSQI